MPRNLPRRLVRITALLDKPGLDPLRLHEEVAYLADRRDVSEEMVRFQSHMAKFTELLEGDGPVGRKLDFLLQELNREINTLASKAQDADISHEVVEVKAVLEKMREQVQNLE